MTKNKIEVLLTIAKNLAEINEKIRTEIIENLGVEIDNIPNKLFDMDANMPVDLIIKHLEKFNYFKNANIESGETIMPPEISFDPNALTFAIAINVKNNNDKFVISNSPLESPSKQVAITYQYAKTNDEIDIAYAEIKKGEIAKAFNLPEDNKNIDIYAFDNPTIESATVMKTIDYADIQNALD